MTIGFYGEMLDLKTSYLSGTVTPRLFLLGGSNVRVSHSGEILERELGIPVVNGGLTAAVSLDFVIQSFQPAMVAGDWVYMPLEYGQYRVGFRDEKTDSQYWLAYDKRSFVSQPPGEMLYGAFSFDLPYIFSGLFEMGLQKLGVSRRLNAASLNANGDQIGHGHSAGRDYRRAIEEWNWTGVSTDVIVEDSSSLRNLRRFLRWAKQNEVVVVGGLPTVFDDYPIPDSVVRWIESIYVAEGHFFLKLENSSTYPRNYFFDTPYHLLEPYQQQHSRELAVKISGLMRQDEETIGVGAVIAPLSED